MSRRGISMRYSCEFCGQSIGIAGFARVSHMRAHVRRGEVREYLTGDWIFGATYKYEATAKGKLLLAKADGTGRVAEAEEKR